MPRRPEGLPAMIVRHPSLVWRIIVSLAGAEIMLETAKIDERILW